MYEIAVYLLDEKYHQEILSSLKSPHYLVHLSSDIKEVITFCNTDMIDAILIWPAKKPLVSNLLDILRKHQLEYLPVIPVVRTPEDFHAISNLEIANIIQIPVPKKEFFPILHSVLDARRYDEKPVVPSPPVESSGDNTSLMEALRISHKNKNDALISVNAGGHIGRIYIRHGDIIRANFRILEGMDALRKLVNLENIDTTIHYTEVDEENLLEKNTTEILSELHSYSREVISAIKKLGAEGEIYRTRDDTDVDSFRKREMEHTILNLCREGNTVYNAFAIMNQENLKILSSIRMLLDKGALVSSEVALKPVEKTKNKGSLKILFQNVQRLWPKKRGRKERLLPEESTPQASDDDVELVQQNLLKSIHIQKLDDMTVEKIQKFLSEL